MNIEDSLTQSVEACEVFSNVQRSLIALLIDVNGEMTWTDLKTEIEELRGPINPNTLSFHLKKLIDSGIVKRGGSDSQPSYIITEKGHTEVEQKLGKTKKELAVS